MLRWETLRSGWVGMTLVALSGFATAQQEEIQRVAICDEILVLANEGRLAPTRLQAEPGFRIDRAEAATFEDTFWDIQPLAIADVDDDGIADRVARGTSGGTCSGSTVFMLDAALARGRASFGFVGFDEMAIDADDHLRWSGWAASDSLHTILGRAVVVTLASGRGSPNLVSFLSVDGKSPVCAYVPVEGETVHVRRARDPELCDAIVDKVLEPIAFDDAVERNPALVEQFSRYQYGGAAVIDLDGDGTDERVAVLRYSSGAGCGHEFAWVVVLDDADDTLSATPLNAVLNPAGSPGRPTPWDDALLFEWRGRVVIAAKHAGLDGVFSVNGDAVRVECEFDRHHHVAIAKRYSGD